MENLLLNLSSATIDTIALIFIGLYALRGLTKGFIRTLLSLFSTVISLILAIIIAPSVVGFLEEKYLLLTKISDTVSGAMEGIFGQELLSLPISLATEENLAAGGINPLFTKIILGLSSSSYPEGTTVGQALNPTFAYYVLVFISIIALFIIIKIIVFIVSMVIKKLLAGKKIAKVDKLLGLVLGVIYGVLSLEMTILLISVIPLPFMQEIYSVIQTSTVTAFISEHSLYTALLDTLSNVNVKEFIINTLRK